MRPDCARRCVSTSRPRKLDLMLACALIEARSCERFALLAPRLPRAARRVSTPALQHAEARHFELYLRLAQRAGGELRRCSRGRRDLAELAAVEAELGSAPDEQLRFHSGPVRGAERGD